jgi:hypothetical protein
MGKYFTFEDNEDGTITCRANLYGVEETVIMQMDFETLVKAVEFIEYPDEIKESLENAVLIPNTVDDARG